MIIFSLIILNIRIGLYIINNYFFNYEKYGIYKKKIKILGIVIRKSVHRNIFLYIFKIKIVFMTLL